MPQIQLLGGEKDGQLITIPSITARPDIYYAVPNDADEQVRAVRGAKAKLAMREKLATLAYVYDKTVRKDRVGWEYQYVRCAEKDKTTEPPAVTK